MPVIPFETEKLGVSRSWPYSELGQLAGRRAVRFQHRFSFSSNAGFLTLL